MTVEATQIATWAETNSATAGVAAATHTPADAQRETPVLLTVRAGYDAAQRGTLTVRVGGADLFTTAVVDELTLPVNYRAGEGEAIQAELSAAGAGVTGRVTILGRTEGS